MLAEGKMDRVCVQNMQGAWYTVEGFCASICQDSIVSSPNLQPATIYNLTINGSLKWCKYSAVPYTNTYNNTTQKSQNKSDHFHPWSKYCSVPNETNIIYEKLVKALKKTTNVQYFTPLILQTVFHYIIYSNQWVCWLGGNTHDKISSGSLLYNLRFSRTHLC